ncbi:unnamed protein product [Gongylonema pulchrum]|uniref:POP1 C-terminal domain-containing protein n=1 Tax=Gongylonema pulchrum TaxID=637853 RepID=A0A183EPG1_9BILA|nr:unnamed protein product [Gongylonema pulchrum]
MKEKKKQKREKAKAAKRSKTIGRDDAQTSASQQPSKELEEQQAAESVEYNTSCSRPIIGRVVRGDYSFTRGKGFAIGYCCLPALKLIRNGQVLFRNTTSKHYHPGKITVLRNQLDL